MGLAYQGVRGAEIRGRVSLHTLKPPRAPVPLNLCKQRGISQNIGRVGWEGAWWQRGAPAARGQGTAGQGSAGGVLLGPSLKCRSGLLIKMQKEKEQPQPAPQLLPCSCGTEPPQKPGRGRQGWLWGRGLGSYLRGWA